MTHSGGKPHEVGDRGQRYELRYTDAYSGEEKVFGWSSTLATAEKMLCGIKIWPSANGGRIVDRQPDKPPHLHTFAK
jgi:hypothetical protein